MGLPFIDEIPKSRSYLQEFRGYNHTNNLADNEFYDCLNLTNDNYPVLSTRPSRLKAPFENARVICTTGDLAENYLFVTDGKLMFNYAGDVKPLGEYDENTKYHLVRMGAQIIAFPVMFAYNTATGECEFFEPTINLKSGSLVNCLSDGTEIALKDKKDAIEGDYFPGKASEGDKSGAVYLREKNEAGAIEDVIVPVYIKVLGESLYSNTLKLKKYTLNQVFNGATGTKVTDENGNVIYTEYKDVINGADWFAVKGYIWGYDRIEFTNRKVTRFKGDTVKKTDNSEKEEYFFEYYYDLPIFDHIIECKNRLWGCRYDGTVNEIYATALGSYKEWKPYKSDAGSACVVSVGTPGEFTGAMTIDENPVFFKENYIHKIYVSPSGAHQLYTLNCRGVQKGSSKSLVRVNESVIYKSKYDVVVFDGTNVTPISEPLGADYYTDAIAGVYDGKYVMWCKREGVPCMFVYDTKYGFWQCESAPDEMIFMVGASTMLYFYTSTYVYSYRSNNVQIGSSKSEGKVPYMFESGIQGLTSPDGKYLVRIDYRVSLGFGDTFNVFIEYDSDGKWHNVARLQGDQPIPKVRSLPIMPRRCDHFRIKVTGRGDMKLYSITKTYEKGAEYGY